MSQIHIHFGYPTGYPRAEKNTRTHLGSGWVRVLPVGKKSYSCPSPSGRVPDGYSISIPKLPSLRVAGVCLVGGAAQEVVEDILAAVVEGLDHHVPTVGHNVNSVAEKSTR
jgi:hypothetical protein